MEMRTFSGDVFAVNSTSLRDSFVRAIRSELELYNTELGSRPEIVAVTKADLPSATEVRRLLAELTGGEVLLISAVTGQGLNDLVGRIALAIQGEPPKW